MDARRFDSLARRLAGTRTRRSLVGALIAGAGVAAVGDSAAATRLTCRANGKSCTRNAQCCGGTCLTSRDLPRAQRNRCSCAPQCGGGACNIDDGCGGTCPGCDDGWVCGDDDVCRAACAGTTGACFLGIDGDEYLNPEACNQNSWTLDGCVSNADCETGSDYPIYQSNHPGNLEAVCAAAFYYNSSQQLTYASGRCFMKPLETGACWD
jgi:hypothetical protein